MIAPYSIGYLLACVTQSVDLTSACARRDLNSQRILRERFTAAVLQPFAYGRIILVSQRW